MCKKLIFLIFVVLLLGLNGPAHADQIDVNNYSFEKDVNGAQITENTFIGNLQGWIRQEPNDHWGYGWWFADDEWGAEGYEAADGTVAIFSVTAGVLGDPCDTCEIYQILEDADANIAANHRYTLTFNALRLSLPVTGNPIAYGALFYSVGAGSANDVILASEAKTLTSPTWGQVGYAGWEEVRVDYIASSGTSSIGKTLGVKLSSPYPWLSGYQVAMDNVHVEWSWATEAWYPDPADGAEDVPRNVTLSWKPGCFAADVNGHEVYFGSTFTEVNDANSSDPEFRGSGSVAGPDPNGRYSYAVPETLDLGGTYYWRIDEVNETNTTWKGAVWSFTAVTADATNPSPGNGAKDVSIFTDLGWTAGEQAVTHEMYFSTDFNDVNDRLISPAIIAGPNSYDPPGDLEFGTTYYWAVDEVNLAADPNRWYGDVWKFTTAEYRVVDDFDSYATDEELWNVWHDVVTGGVNGYVDREMDPNFTHDGNSMKYEYINKQTGGPTTKRYSETWANIAGPNSLGIDPNWLAGGAKALVLYFYGQAANDATQKLYLVLGDGSNEGVVKYDGDANDIKEAEWHEWNIDLADPCLAGVVLTNVSRIYIGFGVRGNTTNPTTTGRGVVYFDDIEIHPPRCRPAYALAAGDLNGDCVIDTSELSMIARDWLMSGYDLPTIPPPTAPILRWQFNEGSGTVSTANSGSYGTAFNATFSTASNERPDWVTDRYEGAYALDWDKTRGGGQGDMDWLAFPSDLNLDTYDLTITMWLKPEGAYGEWDWPSLLESRSSTSGTGFGVGSWGELMYWSNDNDYWNWHSDLWLTPGIWSFAALTIEPNQGVIYLDEGLGPVSRTHVAPHAKLRDFDAGYANRIGANTTGDTYGHHGYNGILDDVRIYDYALSASNIAYLTGHNHVPLEDWRADINDDDKVDFKDYAVMANNWLDEILWPFE